jgi:DNA-binding Lrp family transcriptional regulator
MIVLDPTDIRLLDLLQTDASISNQELAMLAHTSPATALRRVRRLVEDGVIEKRVALLSPQALGDGLTALVEITLDRQGAEHLEAFENRAVNDAAVQQVYRVSPGPDFVLVVYAPDMAAYHALAQRLFTQDANVRNVKAFFAIKRAKFDPRLPLSSSGSPAP